MENNPLQFVTILSCFCYKILDKHGSLCDKILDKYVTLCDKKKSQCKNIGSVINPQTKTYFISILFLLINLYTISVK